VKIGIDVTCWANRRGFGRVTRELITALIGLSSDDEHVLFADRQTAESVSFPENCRVVVADTSVAAAEAASADGRRSLRDVWAMRRIVRTERPDVMFFPTVYSYFPIARGVPCAVTFCDVIAESLPHKVFRSRKARLFWQLKCRMALRRAERVITISSASRDGLIREFHLAPQRISVVGLAPASGFAAAAKGGPNPEALARQGIGPGSRYLLYVGGISPHKNIDTLIEAFTIVRNDPRARDVRLVLVGDYAGDAFLTCYEELRGLVDRLGLGSAVHFAGFVPDGDLAQLYAGCQVFVLPSFLEGFGLPAVEAMVCGAAVLASNRGSLPEVVGAADQLFDPADARSMADAILDVLTDDARRDELRRRSATRAKLFSWEQAARQLSDVLHEVGR